MVYVVCEKCGEQMDLTQEDDRQEWYEGTYECKDCGKIKIHKQWRDQNGLVTSDEIYVKP